jgi:uncharacterized phage-associated protein
MASVHDVAAYIVANQGSLSAMKLQKLVYYAQAWSLVWEGRPLFSESIEAWANGPVVRELYEHHRGQFEVRNWPEGHPEKLSAADRATIDAVLGFYGGKPAQWLSDLTHKEQPWCEARRGAPEGARSSAIITPEAMRAYYGSL